MLDTERVTCETQQSIYEYMAAQSYDMKVFSDAFLSSDFCRRAFDTVYSRFQWQTVRENADFFMPEIGEKLTKYEGGCWFEPDEAAWLGFTYRHLYMETRVPSAQLMKIYPFERLLENYWGLHTIETENAVGILIESYKDEIWDENRLSNMGFYKKGVEIKEKPFYFEMPQSIQTAITEFITACNSASAIGAHMGALYQELNKNLNITLSAEQIEEIRNYYMFGGMYNNSENKFHR